MKELTSETLATLGDSIGRDRLIQSPFTRLFAVSRDTTGIFNGVTCGKIFLDGNDGLKAWRYLREPRTFEQLKRFSLAKGERVADFAKLFTELIDGGYLIRDGQSPSRIMKSTAMIPDSTPLLSHLYLVPYYGCNFSCPHCFVTAGLSPARTKPISRRDLLKGIDVFYENLEPDVAPKIKLFGGEPLVKFDIIREAVSHIRRLERRRISRNKQLSPGTFRLFTNGSLIDEGIAAWLYANDIGVTLSLDGRRRAHDRMRRFRDGGGTFDSVMDGISNLKRFGIDFSLGVVIGKENIDSIEGDVKWMARDVSKRFSFNIMQEFLAGKNPGSLGRKGTRKLFGVLTRIYDYFDRHGIHESKYESSWRRFINERRIFMYCTAHGNEVALMPDGKFAPCHHLIHTDEHRIRPKRGMRIQETGVWRRWMGRSAANLAIQDELCPYRMICAGGCAVSAMAAGRKLNECDPGACSLVEFYLDRMMKRFYLKHSCDG